MPTRAEVNQWNPTLLADAGQRILAQNQEFTSGIDRLRADIQTAGSHWDGDAYWAAYNRIGEDHDAGTKLAQEVTALAEATIAGASTITSYRGVVLARVGDAEGAGFTVGDDWTVTASDTGEESDRSAHQSLIAQARNELMAAVAQVNRSISEARDAVRDRGSALGDDPAALGAKPNISRDGLSVIIETTDENDVITVEHDPKTGVATVTVNGEKQTFTGTDAENLVIKSRGGDDLITVANGTQVGVKVEGGDGKDTIFGGKGRDYLEGGAGQDTIHGGEGNDVIYGGADDDSLFGGEGEDYVEGGSGNDRIAGHAGNDILSGGLGDDFIEGNEGSDKIYAGDGTDNVSGSGVNTAANGNGNDTIYAQEGVDTISRHGDQPTVVNVELAQIPEKIVVTGSPEFQERVRSDLEFMRSSPTGQQMLTSFANTDHTVTIVEAANERSNAMPGDWKPASYNPATGTPGAGTSVTVAYDPRTTDLGFGYEKYAWGAELPPSLVLTHELAHATDFTHGTFRGGTYQGDDKIDGNSAGVREGERVAVGLPIDHDNNPSTPEQVVPEHPTALTENAMRTELGLPLREHYESQ
ncbi:M91 family zinc metallopeptidase [Nocardia sp. NPDC058658]|uniref:M91 family zinc metallopeptidase n=1 Tax=Nocardia sp. NPDC058658 TaxID=3346580 RepID=UPI003660436D